VEWMSVQAWARIAEALVALPPPEPTAAAAMTEATFGEFAVADAQRAAAQIRLIGRCTANH
jgi:hypothetical protein